MVLKSILENLFHDSLLYHRHTGCYQCKVGENEIKGEIHLFDMSFNYAQAKAYRKKQGGYLRANQWYDLEAEVWIAI